jgi:transcription initiation factor TFIIIB Brf1 subunit/transcription initiation factor TFIIB
MRLKICPYCGIKLEIIESDKLWCSNCGIIEEQEEVNENKKRDYIR